MQASMSFSALSMSIVSFGSLGRIRSATSHHTALAVAWSGWAKAVPLKVGTTRRLFLAAGARALCWKWTQHRRRLVERTRPVSP